MTTKLTLSVEKEVIEKAKQYAQKHHKSLSQLVEHYLEYLTEGEKYAPEIDPEVLDLADEITPEELPDIDEAKYRYLKDKYLK